MKTGRLGHFLAVVLALAICVGSVFGQDLSSRRRFYASSWGSDSVTFAQSQVAATPAATISKIFTLVAANGGFKEGDKVCVSGTIRGTVADPVAGYALYNFALNQVGVEFGPWLDSDGAPSGGNKLVPPVLRGDIPFDASWTNVGGGVHTRTFALPSGVTEVTAVLYRWGLVTARDGRVQAHLAAQPDVSTVTGGTNRFFRNTGTNLLTITVTNPAGTAVTSSLASGDITFCVSGTATNALLCLQNAKNCRVWGFTTANTSGGTGIYHISTENADGCVIEDCVAVDGGGHHAYGHTGLNSASTTNNVIRRCSVVGGMYGVGASISATARVARPFSLFGGTLTGNVIEDCYAVCRPVLNPAGAETYAGATSGGGYGPVSIVGMTSGGAANNVVRRCTFIMADQATNGSPANLELGGGATVSEANTYTVSAYPATFTQCTFQDAATLGFQANGVFYIAAAFDRCVFTGGPTIRVAAGSSTNAAIRPVGGSSGGGKYLFKDSLAVANFSHTTVGTTGFFFELIANVDLAVDGCAVLDTALASRTYGVFYPSSASNNKLRVRNSLLGSVYTRTNSKLLVVDSSFPDNQLECSGNTYLNIDTGAYSAKTSRDTFAEWQATIDALGVECNNGLLSTAWFSARNTVVGRAEVGAGGGASAVTFGRTTGAVSGAVGLPAGSGVTAEP